MKLKKKKKMEILAKK